MTTGMRRGEVCALRWAHIDLDTATVEVRSAYVLRRGVGRMKDTKTHQMRRIALDTETVVLLREHRERCRARLASLSWAARPASSPACRIPATARRTRRTR